MRPHADRAPALAVQGHDCLGGDLPLVCNIRQSRIYRASSLCSARTVECKFDERDQLVHWLVLGQLARSVATTEIVHAVLEREGPVQRIDVAHKHRGELARLL